MSIYDQFTEQELTILHARAERIAHATQQALEARLLSALLVTVRGETYALPILTINYILDDSARVVPVPCVPPHVAGIANSRGRIIPVLDLGLTLGVPGEPSADTPVLIEVTHEDVTVAFQVDGVGETTDVRLDDLVAVPSTLDIAKMEYLQGVLPNGVALLDLEAILEDPTLIVE